MCTPPLGPVGASPDDSQAASGPSDRSAVAHAPCGYPCPVSGLRAIRARALCVLTLALAGVAALAVGVAAGSSAAAAHDGVGLRRPDQRARRAVERHADLAGRLVPVPRPRLGRTPTPPARRSAASARYGHSELTGVSLLGGVVTAGAIAARTYADGAQGAGHAATFGGAVTGSRRRTARPSRCSPAAQFDDPGHRLGRGRRAPRRALRRAPTAAPRSRSTSTSTSTGTTCRRAPRSCSATRTPRRSRAPGGARPRRQAPRRRAATDGAGRRAAASPRPTRLAARRARRPAAGRATATPTDSGDGVTPTGIEAPPPGGFTLTPPIDPGRAAAAARAELRLPGRRRRALRPRLRQLRAPTRGFHEGSDLFAPDGTPLVAVQSGVLHNVGWNRLGGWRLWLEDAHGNWFYYAHLSAYSPIAKNGAHVNAGDVIGFVGNTGDAAGHAVRTCTSRSTRRASGPCRRTTTCRPGRVTATRSRRSRRRRRRPSRPPQLGSTDISAASGLDTAAVLAVAERRTRRHRRWWRSACPRPTAAELLAGSSGTMTLQTALGVLERGARARLPRAGSSRTPSTRSSPSAGTRSRRCRGRCASASSATPRCAR